MFEQSIKEVVEAEPADLDQLKAADPPRSGLSESEIKLPKAMSPTFPISEDKEERETKLTDVDLDADFSILSSTDESENEEQAFSHELTCKASKEVKKLSYFPQYQIR